MAPETFGLRFTMWARLLMAAETQLGLCTVSSHDAWRAISD